MKDKFMEIDINNNGFLDDHEFEDAFKNLQNEIIELHSQFTLNNEK